MVFFADDELYKVIQDKIKNDHRVALIYMFEESKEILKNT